ncbi:MAG: GGDEF domain-containing protein [Pseudomonadota bacterium]|nr:GGDEF domain-containing protein [Pseudomonadota bacterium]
MTQTPNVIGTAVMQLLKDRGEPATPDNYERTYYELSGLPHPAKPSEPADDNSANLQLLAMLREMVQEITNKTEHLAHDLGEKNQGLSENVSSLKSCRDKNEILRLLSSVVMQAGSIHSTVESSHQELLETRQSLNAMQEELAETRQMLNEDALTGALNRRGLDATLSREIARAQRVNARLSLAMVDLDYFKKINDDFGHAAGDQMLMHFTSLIRSVMRKSDALVRYGGEEFTLILPDTDARGAHFVLGRLQQVMARTPLNYEGKQINTTFSAGVATLKPDENGHALLRRADDAVYAAKNAGRNTIKMAH